MQTIQIVHFLSLKLTRVEIGACCSLRLRASYLPGCVRLGGPALPPPAHPHGPAAAAPPAATAERRF